MLVSELSILQTYKMHCTNETSIIKTFVYSFVINNSRYVLKVAGSVKKVGLYSSKIIQKTNMAYLELYTHMNWHRNSHRLAHT